MVPESYEFIQVLFERRMRDAETIYAADSLEGRVLRGDPVAIGEVIRWIALVLVGPRFWRLRNDWPDLHQECLRRLLVSLREARFDSSRDFRAYVQSLARYTALEARDRLPRTSAKASPLPFSNQGAVEADAVPMHGHAQSLRLEIPPLGVLIFTAEP